MSYQVEYLIDVSAERARVWLSHLSGWFKPESLDEMPGGEFEWNDLSVFADLAPTACHAQLPQVYYSWLIADHALSLEQVSRFETWLVESLPGVRLVRVDEFIKEKWEFETGRTWDQWPDPVAALSDWLRESNTDTRYFRLLP